MALFYPPIKRFHDEELARQHLEDIRWEDGPVCPHCGGTERIWKIGGETARSGLYSCGDCRRQFTVTVGTLIERSKIPLTKWLMAVHLLSSVKKRVSIHQLHLLLGLTYKTAWFMAYRVRGAMQAAPGSAKRGVRGKKARGRNLPRARPQLNPDEVLHRMLNMPPQPHKERPKRRRRSAA